ncbi:hypothetical protein [Caballeronia sp. dw_276]|nr:hypothetical protein [Caballeronia sp. dw_276]
MNLVIELFIAWFAVASVIALSLGYFIQINRPAAMHAEWVRSGDAA